MLQITCHRHGRKSTVFALQQFAEKALASKKRLPKCTTPANGEKAQKLTQNKTTEHVGIGK
eukprot:4661280-Amphidinium_carterae.1